MFLNIFLCTFIPVKLVWTPIIFKITLFSAINHRIYRRGTFAQHARQYFSIKFNRKPAIRFTAKLKISLNNNCSWNLMSTESPTHHNSTYLFIYAETFCSVIHIIILIETNFLRIHKNNLQCLNKSAFNSQNI